MARVLALALALCVSSAFAVEFCLDGFANTDCTGDSNGLCGDITSDACFMVGAGLYAKAVFSMTECTDGGAIDTFTLYTDSGCTTVDNPVINSIAVGTCKVSGHAEFASLMVSCPKKSKCFPASATVELEDGSHKTMAQVEVGDKVRVSATEFSPVYMFSHRLEAAKAAFVTVEAGTVSLQLTPDHYLYVNGVLAAASTVKVADEITLADGSKAAVTKVHTTWAQGLYNPHTMHGDIVVNGVQTSTYTQGIAPALAHAALWPVRAMYAAGVSVADETTFAAGSQLLADVLPNGKAKY